jgi:hypothetical protein
MHVYRISAGSHLQAESSTIVGRISRESPTTSRDLATRGGGNNSASLPLRQREKGRSGARLLSRTRPEKSQAPQAALLLHGRGTQREQRRQAAVAMQETPMRRHAAAPHNKGRKRARRPQAAAIKPRRGKERRQRTSAGLPYVRPRPRRKDEGAAKPLLLIVKPHVNKPKGCRTHAAMGARKRSW